jgi:hypothetical protein
MDDKTSSNAGSLAGQPLSPAYEPLLPARKPLLPTHNIAAPSSKYADPEGPRDARFDRLFVQFLGSAIVVAICFYSNVILQESSRRLYNQGFLRFMATFGMLVAWLFYHGIALAHADPLHRR